MKSNLKSKATIKSQKIFGGRFEIDRKEARLKEIAELESLEGFWNDNDNATKVQHEKALLEDVVLLYKGLKDAHDEIEILIEYVEGGDEDSKPELNETLTKFLSSYSKAELKVLLSEEADPNNAIVSINAGAGGTESCDWASMLFRMLTRWAESKKFKCELLDEQAGDSAGIKSATFTVTGPYAYGQLKSETGVHRLVRISPFDSNARRHTSFASVFVTPEVDDSIEIEILDKDLKIDVFRASGAGGQHVNTTDSAVRITHIPSGIVVACQNQRSQHQNKAHAMKVLKSRLYERELEKQKAAAAEEEANKKAIDFGAQIRSYVLHPYKMVKDHRTNHESSNADKVLDGDIDQFSDAYLRWCVNESINADEEEA